MPTFPNEYYGYDWSKVKQGNTPEQDEANFIKFLEKAKTGLRLLKGDVNTFGTWEKRGTNSRGRVF